MNLQNETIQYISLISIDNDIEINKMDVIRLNYDININKFSKHSLLKFLNQDISFISKKKKYVFLIDYDNIKLSNLDVDKVKYLIQNFDETLSDCIEKSIVYNYNNVDKMIADVILSFLDKTSRSKVVFKKKLEL
tara:strand:- start:3552 stop:3956 length:405 start_codon:yes stop_codon:yes gene_type:complete